VVCLKRKFPSSTSERGDRLSNRNETKFDFIAKEEEECGLLCISNEGENAKYEKCVVLFHSIRNLDVKLQLGHPLPLKTLVKVHQYQICISFPR
jgi:hypothetical protein